MSTGIVAIEMPPVWRGECHDDEVYGRRRAEPDDPMGQPSHTLSLRTAGANRRDSAAEIPAPLRRGLHFCFFYGVFGGQIASAVDQDVRSGT